MWSRQAHDWERCRGFKCRRCDALNAACLENESLLACTAPFCTRVYPRVSFLHTMSVRIIEHPTARRDEWKISHCTRAAFWQRRCSPSMSPDSKPLCISCCCARVPRLSGLVWAAFRDKKSGAIDYALCSHVRTLSHTATAVDEREFVVLPIDSR